MIQINFDILAYRNRSFQSNYHVQSNGHQQALAQEDDDDLQAFQEVQYKMFEQNCKIFFIFRDFYLLTKV